MTNKSDEEYVNAIVRKAEEAEARIERVPSWQHYKQDMDVNEDSVVPLGFHKGYAADDNRQIINLLNTITVFPHFCLSFYNHPEMTLIMDVERGNPAVYESDLYHNIGWETVVKSWDIFMMYMGWPDAIIKDIGMLVASARKFTGLWSGHDMITDLFSIARNDHFLESTGQKIETDIDYEYELEPMRKMYEEQFSPIDNYHRFLYFSRLIHISVKLSPETQNNIARSNFKGLVPFCQIPFGLGGYHHILERDFGWEENRWPKINLMGVNYPIFSITPGIFGHKCGAFYDPDTGMVIGKRPWIAAFIRYLSKMSLLHVQDLDYLV